MPIKTKTRGIFAGDVILRTALQYGMEDIRRNPYLLDYAFAQFEEDDISKKLYGDNTLARAKEWFLKTDIPVYMDSRIGEAVFPCLVIKQVSENETEKTLGDVDGTAPYEVVDNFPKWDNLVPPFDPVSYDPTTGVVTLPQTVLDNLFVVSGMVLVDGKDVQHPILEAVNPTTITIAPGQFDLSNSVIRGSAPSYIASMESVGVQSTFQIGCFCDSENQDLLFLHAITVFILLRYKENLIESRYYEKTQISSSDFIQNGISTVQAIFSRYITITGQARHYWPKQILPRIVEVVPELSASPVNSNTPVVDLWDEESIPANWNQTTKNCK